MEDKAAATHISITPKLVYGLRKDVVGSILYSFNQEVIYAVEGVLVFHDFATNKQRYLRFPENTLPTVMCLNTNRRLIAIAEETKSPDNTTFWNIAVYDTISLKKRRNFEMPSSGLKKEVRQMSFIYDSRGLLVITKHPLEMLYMMYFDKNGTIAETQIGQPNQRMTASCVAGNPHDPALVAVCGDGIFKLLSNTETGFTLSSNMKAQFAVRSMAWLSMEALMLGLRKNKLALIENGELKLTFVATEIELIDVSKDADAEEQATEGQEEVVKVAISLDEVCCMVALPKVLVYAIGDEVYVFEKVSKYVYQRLVIIKLHKTIFPEELYKITNMAVNTHQDTVIVTAKHSQIYVCSWKGLVVGETTTVLQFKPLGELIHINEIVDISVCSWRPIIMTASKDQTIRIWNYETETVEFVKKYQVDITVTELNPTGQFAAIGFSDQLRIMQIFMDDLNIMKTYNFPRCAQVKYSYYGHLMAASYDNCISITSVYNLDIIRHLKGHNGNVLSLAWSRDDKYLVSGGAEGAIYQWEVETGSRVQELVQKGTEYKGLYCTNYPLSIFSITGSGFIRQMANSEMLRELGTPSKAPLLSMALARSDQIMFVSTANGHLYNVHIPLLDANSTYTNNRFFISPVTNIKFSHDNTLLITGSKSGTLVIWILQNIADKIAPMDQDLLKGQEILIPRSVLQDKIAQISNLETRLLQQAAEFQYQESQNEIFDSQQLADIHKGYCQALEALKNQNNELEHKHIEELNEITFRINDLKADQKMQIENLSEQFRERMLMEYQKFTSFNQSSYEIKDGYEEKLRKSAGYLQDTVEALEIDFKNQLEKREELIRDLMQEIEDEKFEFNEYCRQVAVENEANMMDTVIKYENAIKAEQDEEIEWRGKAGVLKKKSDTMSKEVERLLEDLELLNEENAKSQKLMAKLMREIEDLRKDVTDREFAINVKEKRIQEILHKNQELEKYKQVLSHRITELKLQIEPRECQINEKRKQITKMEQELDSINKCNVQLELQLKNRTENYVQSINELKNERRRARNAREYISTICTEIYHVAGKINDPKELKNGVLSLYQKYASDEALHKHITLEKLVQAEFNRQRTHMEKSIRASKRNMENQSEIERASQILSENMKLLKDIEVLRKQTATLSKDLGKLSSTLKLPAKKKGNTKTKLANTLQDIETQRVKNKEHSKFLTAKLNMVKTNNEKLQKELQDLKDGKT